VYANCIGRRIHEELSLEAREGVRSIKKERRSLRKFRLIPRAKNRSGLDGWISLREKKEGESFRVWLHLYRDRRRVRSDEGPLNDYKARANVGMTAARLRANSRLITHVYICVRVYYNAI